MSTLLNSDDLNVVCEDHIFQALMSWIQHESDARRQYIGHLLGLVKLPLLSPAFLTDQVEPVCEGMKCLLRKSFKNLSLLMSIIAYVVRVMF